MSTSLGIEGLRCDGCQKISRWLVNCFCRLVVCRTCWKRHQKEHPHQRKRSGKIGCGLPFGLLIMK